MDEFRLGFGVFGDDLSFFDEMGPRSVISYETIAPDPKRIVDEPVGDDYIVLTQRPNYQTEAAWRNEAERPEFIKANGLSFLRHYQKRAVHSLQAAVRAGKDRFLFEMATGTGKTLTAAAIIKLFLRSGNLSKFANRFKFNRNWQ